MHLMFAMRGHHHWGKRFIDELQSRYFPFKKYNPETKQMQEYILEGRLCPIQLYDYIFPAEHFDAVANTIFSGTKGEPNAPALKKYFWLVRKALGYKEIPEYKKDNRLPMSPPDSCEIIGIGIKDDYWINENGEKVDKEHKTPLSWEGL